MLLVLRSSRNGVNFVCLFLECEGEKGKEFRTQFSAFYIFYSLFFHLYSFYFFVIHFTIYFFVIHFTITKKGM